METLSKVPQSLCPSAGDPAPLYKSERGDPGACLGAEGPGEYNGREAGRVEGMRTACPLWAVRAISVPDLGQQGALLHMGPACVSDKTASPVCRHVFLRVCA